MQINKLRTALFILWYIIWALVLVFCLTNDLESKGNYYIVLPFIVFSIFIGPIIEKLAPKNKSEGGKNEK